MLTQGCQRAVCPGLGLIKGEIGEGTVSGVRWVRLGAQTDRDGVLLAEVPYEGVAKVRPFSSVMTAALGQRAALGTQPLMAAAFTQPGVLLSRPRRRQLGAETPKSALGDTRADTMRESRTGKGSLHNHPTRAALLTFPTLTPVFCGRRESVTFYGSGMHNG
ncbi:hypothetical protein [Streptomyces sp. Tue6028]|uniref:hypothetical protein n=1 Tax=Streptomyces sp. Tue6028 TaxID=2036037 RepID=UPI003D74F411